MISKRLFGVLCGGSAIRRKILTSEKVDSHSSKAPSSKALVVVAVVSLDMLKRPVIRTITLILAVSSLYLASVCSADCMANCEARRRFGSSLFLAWVGNFRRTSSSSTAASSSWCLFQQSAKQFSTQRHCVAAMSLSPSVSQEIPATCEKDQRPTLIVLAGPTASGKSDVAALLGDGIVVSADSVQAYQGVQIGANKPTLEERAATPHLLIDVANADVSYNAAEWTRDALYCVRKLLCLKEAEEDESEDSNSQGRKKSKHNNNKRNFEDTETVIRQKNIDQEIQKAKAIRGIAADQPVTPVIVGGTMMYLQWLVHGRPDAMRPSSLALEKAKEMIATFEQEEDWQGAIQHVESLGEKFAEQSAKLSNRDYYRLRRIMEVAYTMEELKGKDDGNDSDTLMEKLYSGQREGGLLSMNEYDVRCFFLCPDDRMAHSKIVDERCEQMLQRGLLRETTDLTLAGALPDMATKAIGYRQTLDYLTRQDPKDGDMETFSQYLKDFTTATRQYSKRQMQWFRKDQQFVFVPVNVALDKETRVAAAASEIRRLVSLPRAEFDQQERLSSDSLSANTRRQNEGQGKGMKVYQLELKHLVDGSEALEKVAKEADCCTNQLQAKRNKLGT